MLHWEGGWECRCPGWEGGTARDRRTAQENEECSDVRALRGTRTLERFAEVALGRSDDPR